jgi:putative FmdB family regulatory protein
MPDYLYECPHCGRFSKIQRITAEPLDVCPTCAAPVKRIIVGGSIFLKGAGEVKGGDWGAKTQVENYHRRQEAAGKE